jgi:hypothetical protein
MAPFLDCMTWVETTVCWTMDIPNSNNKHYYFNHLNVFSTQYVFFMPPCPQTLYKSQHQESVCHSLIDLSFIIIFSFIWKGNLVVSVEGGKSREFSHLTSLHECPLDAFTFQFLDSIQFLYIFSPSISPTGSSSTL